MHETNRYFEANWNRTLLTYRFANGSYIEFFSAEQESKLRGARRNVLYINEANNISFESYHQLAIRTSDDIWLDFNPTSEFWAHTEVLKDNDSEHIILNYKDNEALPENIIKDKDNNQSIKVVQLNLDGTLVKLWDSIKQIKREIGFNTFGIIKCCKKEKKYNTAYGYKWEYFHTYNSN